MSSKDSSQIFQQLVHLQASALSAISDGVMITDPDGYIIWVNPAYSEITGYTADEVIGKHSRILKSGKQNDSYYKDLWDTVNAGNVWHGELWNTRKNGCHYLEDQSITPVKDQHGIINNFIAIKRDISDQYKLRQKLINAHKMDAMSQLTGGIAHNFNNKLATILGYSELVIESITPYKNPELDDYMVEILSSCTAAHKLVEQMLSFSREDFTELHFIDPIPVLHETLKIASANIPSSVIITTGTESNIPMIKSDQVQLHQMLMTLCVNARDAMDNKGILDISVCQTHITNAQCTSCHEIINGNFVEFYVSDSGQGISQKDLERIFLPFFTTREMANGTGMGLSVLHGTLHDQGGHILVDTEKGVGTTFRLLFPVYPEQRQNETPPTDLVSTQLDTQSTDKSVSAPLANIPKLLIVDDDITFATMLNTLFSHTDYQVEIVTDSNLVLEKFQTEPEKFDLLITDQTMPNHSGNELAQAIHAIRPDIPIIIMSGMDESANEVSIVKENPLIEFINKPFKLVEIVQKISQLLSTQ